MPFEEVALRRPNTRSASQASVAITATLGLRIWFRRQFATDMSGWGRGTRTALLVGTGIDHGKVRVVRHPHGSASVRMMARGSFSISFGKVPELGEELREVAPTDPVKIDVDTIEVELPWAFAKRKVKISAESKLPRAANIAAPPERMNSVVPSPCLEPLRRPEPVPPPVTPLARTKISISHGGIEISDERIIYNGKTAPIIESQARFLGVLLVGLGNVMVTGDIIQRTGRSAEELRGDFIDLQRPLQQIGLKLSPVGRMGYCLAKDS